MPLHWIERRQPFTAPPLGTLSAGAATADITPTIGLPMAGYSTQGQVATGVIGRLFARALYLEDADGERVALVALDLMSASRYLLEAVASRTSAFGVGTDRLVLAGTHTHTGPGWFYGNSLYDEFACVEAGFDEGLATWMAARIAEAVDVARGRARPARVGFGTRACWGVSRNRSKPAFDCNPTALSWNSGPFPGANAPGGLFPEQRAVDPRVRTLAAFDRGSGAPIGVFATFSCHSTATGACLRSYSSDWPGFASRTARWALARRWGGDAVVGVALSAAGDVNALRTGLADPEPVGLDLARRVGVRVGDTIAAAVEDAAATASESVRIECRYDEPPTSGRSGPPPAPGTRLADRWYFGAPTIGGSEESRTPFYRAGLVREGMRGDDFAPDDPQYPKARALGPAFDLVRATLGLCASPVFPLHVVRIGGLLIGTVPGEPTGHAAFALEKALLEAVRPEAAFIVGYAGDYVGYITTPEEYDAQHYEGASTIFGRPTLPHLVARLVALATAPTTCAPSAGPIAFRAGRPRTRFVAADCGGVADPRPGVTSCGERISVHWQMGADFNLLFASGWVVRVERRGADGSWSPLSHMGRDFDDVHHSIGVHRVDSTTWAADFSLPEGSGDLAGLRVRGAPRDGFPGFVAALGPS